MKDKLLPQNIEYEQSLLASALLYPDDQIFDEVGRHDFYRSAHAEIWQALVDLHMANAPIDTTTAMTRLKETNKLEKIGGASYLAQLTDCPIASNVEHYAKKLKSLSILRKIIMTAHNVMTGAYDANGDAQKVIDEAQSAFLSINCDSEVPTPSKMRDLAISGLDRYEKLAKSPGSVTGIPTQFADLDCATCGLQKSDLIIIAGRPSMGKTALMLGLAANMAASHSIGIFSLEMSKDQLTDRIIALESNVNSLKFRSGRFSKDDWLAINEASSKVYSWPLEIDDTPALAYQELRRRARRMKKHSETEIIFIDYLQLIQGDKAGGRVEEISSVTRNLKAMAKELGIPVVALAQLNRACEMRENKRPRLSDLRDSGQIEQDADLICFLYRDDIYNKSKGNPKRGICELEIAKQRTGPVGTIRLQWDQTTMRFRTLIKGESR